jgi:hypothetical protein
LFFWTLINAENADFSKKDDWHFTQSSFAFLVELDIVTLQA